jgi:membrane-bound lytic murein transglycosylase D
LVTQLAKWAMAVGIALAATPGAAATDLFPRPEALEPNVAFWLRIYSEVPSTRGLIHDTVHLGVVYGEVVFPDGASARERNRIADAARKPIEKALEALGRGRRSHLGPTGKAVLASWPRGVRSDELRAAASRVRVQTGQADRFREGLIRAGRYRDHIHATLQEAGLPRDLAALPHVESSFNPAARSRAGAAGLWQFTASTARRFMRVDRVQDQRRDPYTSTRAAAQLLAQNLEITGSWPLAITAYNHGAGGVRRAVRITGSTDLAVIVEKYRGRTFGFASRNFYAEFLAAREIEADPEKYFGPLPEAPVERFEIVRIEHFVPAGALAKHFGISTAQLRAANPALKETVWSGAKHIPKGFELRLPATDVRSLAALPARHRYARQIPDQNYTVRRGDALSKIAARHGVTQRQLMALNGLRNPNRIRIGQKLQLPFAKAPDVVAGVYDYPGARAPTGSVVVRAGDTLSQIARRFGTTTAELVRQNGLGNRNRIRIGQVLRLDRSDGSRNPGSERRAGDPTDYSVRPDGSIEVEASETLGHYAAWLGISVDALRSRNGIGRNRRLDVGRRIELDFVRVRPNEFETQRVAHHRALQRAYFERFEIVGTRTHRARSGESLWWLAEKHFGIPLWLLRHYNPDIGSRELHVGTELLAPRVRGHGPATSGG